MTSRIIDFPLEITAKLFQEMEIQDAWAARGVCRYWHDAFEMVAYRSTESPLRGIRIGVDAICGIKSCVGETLDRHKVHGDLILDSSRKANGPINNRQARWLGEKKFEYWPRGKWETYEFENVLTDIKLQISGLPSSTQSVTLRLGPEISVLGTHMQQGNITEYARSGSGKFKDFTLLIDTVEEPPYCGKLYKKHCITGFVAPKWQIYALLVHYVKLHREMSARLRRHYLRSYTNAYSHVMAKSSVSEPRRRHTICAVGDQWMSRVARLSVPEIEC